MSNNLPSADCGCRRKAAWSHTIFAMKTFDYVKGKPEGRERESKRILNVKTNIKYKVKAN